MPKVVLKNKTGSINVTNMVSTIKWSGSTSQIARVLELDFLYPLHDHYTPKIYPNIGDEMICQHLFRQFFEGYFCMLRDLQLKA